MRLWNSLKKDIRIQFRHGFYFVYLILCAVYIAILFALGEQARAIMHSLFIFEDPATMGYIFVGGMVLLERQERSLQTVFISPLSISDYLASKVLSINLLSLSAALLISLFMKGISFNVLLLIWGISLTSPVFTLLGLALSTRFKSLNSMLMITGVAAGLINAPLIAYWDRFYHPVFEAFPPLASLRIIDMALGHSLWNGGQFILSSLVLLSWSAAMYLWAHLWFKKYLVSQSGVQI